MIIRSITIRGQSGKEYTRKAIIVDYVGVDGSAYSLAYVGKSTYRIVERNGSENVWGKA